MRQEARERVSDLIYIEALNDDIVEEVSALEVEVSATTDPDTMETVRVSPALAYLLMDELRIGSSPFFERAWIRVTWHKPAERERTPDEFPAT